MLGLMCLQTLTPSSPAALALATSTHSEPEAVQRKKSVSQELSKRRRQQVGEKARLRFFPLHSVLLQERTYTENVKI